MDRRTFIGGVCLFGTFFTASDRAEAKIEEYADLQPPDFAIPPVSYTKGEEIPTLSQYLDEIESLTGKHSPQAREVDLAIELLFSIPGTGNSPYEIAYEFYRWRRGEVGVSAKERQQRQYYSREWPVRGNPVIMAFFDATGLRQVQGDYTFWCAAFVSWCIARSSGGVKDQGNPWPYQAGAASAAYRTWGKNVLTDLGSSPQRGDVAVFQRVGAAAQGHIGFVHDVTADSVWVLGGNQGAQNDYNGGEVNISKFSRTTGGALKFHSFRRHEVLG